MSTKVGINGFGRIGRQVYKAIREKYHGALDVVAIEAGVAGSHGPHEPAAGWSGHLGRDHHRVDLLEPEGAAALSGVELELLELGHGPGDRLVAALGADPRRLEPGDPPIGVDKALAQH